MLGRLVYSIDMFLRRIFVLKYKIKVRFDGKLRATPKEWTIGVDNSYFNNVCWLNSNIGEFEKDWFLTQKVLNDFFLSNRDPILEVNYYFKSKSDKLRFILSCM